MENKTHTVKSPYQTNKILSEFDINPPYGLSLPAQKRQLCHKLQTSLEIETLLSHYFAYLQNSFNIKGLEYTLPQNQLVLHLGQSAPIHHTHDLHAEDDYVGQLTVFSPTILEKNILQKLSKLSQLLVFPLRNAITYQQAKHSAQTDFLTGAGNRSALDTVLAREHELAQRHHHSLSVLMLDLDHFKKINDQYGHPFGDQVLKRFVKQVQTVARTSDSIFRYGGEEFAVILSNTHLHGAIVIAERIRKAIQSLQFYTLHGNEVSVTVSIGAAALCPNETVDELLARADKYLYIAKSQGRNRCAGYTSSPAPNLAAASEIRLAQSV